MNSKSVESHDPHWWLTFWLFVAFVACTLFSVEFALFDTPPGSIGKVFITEAEPYYFDKSSFEDKEYEFARSADLWLSLSNVSDVGMVGEVEGSDLDVLEAPYVYCVTIDGERMVLWLEKTPKQNRLYHNAILQMSANAWNRRVELTIRILRIWARVSVVFIARLVYLRKRYGWHFAITIERA